MKNKTQQDLETLINSYSYLPKHLLVRYTYDCALEAKHLMRKEGLECLTVVDRWLRGEATEEECRAAGDKVNTTFYTAYAAYTAANAAANAAYTAAYAAVNATYAAIHASQALDKPISYYYDKFTTMLNNLTALEKSLWLKEIR